MSGRIAKNRIYQVIFVLASLQTLYLTLHSSSNPAKEWPTELKGDRSAYCRLASYGTCKENAWFGIMRSHPRSDAVLKEVCRAWNEGRDAATARIIDSVDGDALLLCRMKAPAQIDGGRFAPK